MRLVRRNAPAARPRTWGSEVHALFAEAAGNPVPPQPWRVLGGPGTGKTSLLVDVAASRIAAGCDPETVLLLTHAKQAAGTVRNAITERLTAQPAESPGNPHSLSELEAGVPGATREPLVRTVHSYAFAVLRRHATAHGNPPPRLLTGSEQDAAIREMLRGDLVDIAAEANPLWPQRLHQALGTTGFADQLRDLMLRATERGYGPEDLIRLGHEHDRPEWVAAGRFAVRHEQAMLLRWSVGVEAPEASAPALNAAELVGAALDALAGDAELLAAERAGLRCLLVDDAQHLDPQAATLVRVLAAGNSTTVVAGDPDQGVFTFRGADPSFLADFDVPANQQIVLTDNHRGGAAIRAAVARIAARLPGAAPQRPKAHGGVATRTVEAGLDDGADVRVRVLGTAAKEAALIADHLRRAHLTRGLPWSNMAVVVRSVPLLLPPLRRALLAAGVPVRQPAIDTPLARRRGASWMLLALRALLAGEAAERDGRASVRLFSAEDALDLLAGPLGAADQISLRRLRRGVRRTAVEAARSRGGNKFPHAGTDLDTEYPWRESSSSRPAEADSSPGDGLGWSAGQDGTGWSSEDMARFADDIDWYGVDVDGRAEYDRWDDVLSEHPDDDAGDGAADSAEPGTLSQAQPATGETVAEVGARGGADSRSSPGAGSGGDGTHTMADNRHHVVDQPSAEILRALLIGTGADGVLAGLTDVESAPLRRVLDSLERARRARRREGGLEDVLWALWTGSRLEKRWSAQSERGGAAGMQADRDLDAAVALFDAAASYVDRLPGTGIEGFVEYLAYQEIPHDRSTPTPHREAVELLSAHAAAGREWDVVAVAGVQEGIWPDPRQRGTLLRTEELVDLASGVDADAWVSRSAPILAAERRLLLVACSRARQSLLVTAVESVTGEQDLVPSRFLAELLGSDGATESGALPVAEPGRALVMHSLVAELRGVVCDSDVEVHRRRQAAHQLARLASAGVAGTAPENWYGTAGLSSAQSLWSDDDSAVALSPSTVELLQTCPLRWALERHGGSDGDNPHAVMGNLVHTLVQALAGKMPPEQVRAALDRSWQSMDSDSGWYSRQERRRTEAMLDTFMTWLHNTRGELTEAGIEVPFDCVLPARSDTERPVRIRGRIDRLERDSAGRFVIVDVKTGKTVVGKDAAAGHAQLATYQVAAASGALTPEQEQHGRDESDHSTGSVDEPGGARLVYVAKPTAKGAATQREQPPLDDETVRTWRDTIHEAASATRGPSFLAMRNDGCRHCMVAGSCPVQDAGRQVTDE